MRFSPRTRRIVSFLIHKFRSLYGIPRSTLREAALDAAHHALHRYDGRASWSTWVRHAVYRGLQELVRVRARSRFRQASLDEIPTLARQTLEARLGEASEDCRAVAGAALVDAVRAEGCNKRRRRLVTASLTGRGWGVSRVLRAFEEMKEVLS